MCGIYIYPQGVEKNVLTELSVKRRGPDGYNTFTRGGYVFNHALLSLTGEFTLQPINHADFTLLFNGEIYNYKSLGSFNSELECLSALYENLYLNLPKELDGEYVIVVFDWARDEVVVFSDVFGTKPMFINLLAEGIELASVPSVHNREDAFSFDVSPNSVLVISLQSRKIKRRFNHHFFDLHQSVEQLDNWTNAFFSAVQKRLPLARPDKSAEQLFIGLSSGYDSGCIAAVLRQLDARFAAYTVMNSRIWEDIFRRSKLINDNAQHILLSDHKKSNLDFDEPEEFKFTIFSIDGTYKEKGSSTKTDSGSVGLAYICSQAKLMKHRVYLSGSGADEIYSDYGFMGKKIYSHSHFGGLFKERLQEHFPWPSFFGSTMRAYLMKEELVGGAFGIEARYPFLDVKLTQEWLSLTPRLKNSGYKFPLQSLMESLQFPFVRNEKLGF
jgi:asparagine synthetase B (glutamine-hydrolysing)